MYRKIEVFVPHFRPLEGKLKLLRRKDLGQSGREDLKLRPLGPEYRARTGAEPPKPVDSSTSGILQFPRIPWRVRISRVFSASSASRGDGTAPYYAPSHPRDG